MACYYSKDNLYKRIEEERKLQELRLLQEKDLESIYPIYVHYVKKSTK